MAPNVISGSPPAVGRRRVNFEQMLARFPEGTLARMDAAAAEGETRSDLLRVAIERELKRRENADQSVQEQPARKSRTVPKSLRTE